MSDADRDLPADLLLLYARRQLNAGDAPPAPRLDRSRPTDDAGGPQPELVLEPDAIVVDDVKAPADASARLTLFRPLGTIMLARMPWSGAVDHDTLQNAIVCAPTAHAAHDPRVLDWLNVIGTMPLSESAVGEAALSASLGADDVAVLERVRTRFAPAHALGVARAAALPQTIVGAEAPTVSAATPSLGAYRRASLVVAWQTALRGNASTDASQERDAAAVQVVSMLRALLGEN